MAASVLHDSVGNRLSQTSNGSVTGYTYASHSNQLTAVDAAGAQQAVGYDKGDNINNFSPAVGNNHQCRL